VAWGLGAALCAVCYFMMSARVNADGSGLHAITMAAGRRPRGMTLAGVALAVAGLVLVLDVLSGARIDAVGVAWGLGAALCAVCYFMMSARVTADGSGLHAITLAAGSLVVATFAVAALGVAGVMPLHFTANDAVIGDVTVSWLLPVSLLGVIATAVAYLLGISGVARLRPSFASLMGLAEVLFAVLAAWLLLDERMTAHQVVGGMVVLLGLALARSGERQGPTGAADAADERIPVPSLNLSESTP
jgi:drug/metabolite transporter (DMT)-like permease